MRYVAKWLLVIFVGIGVMTASGVYACGSAMPDTWMKYENGGWKMYDASGDGMMVRDATFIEKSAHYAGEFFVTVLQFTGFFFVMDIIGFIFDYDMVPLGISLLLFGFVVYLIFKIFSLLFRKHDKKNGINLDNHPKEETIDKSVYHSGRVRFIKWIVIVVIALVIIIAIFGSGGCG